MAKQEPSHRKKLNQDQLHIIYLLYRFRFGTTALFTQSNKTKISRQYTDKRLQILRQQNYIGRKYEDSYKLQGRAASYYLAKEGIKLLKQSDKFDPKVLRKIAQDKRRGDAFVDHCLGIFAIYNQCRQQHGDDLLFYTQNYLGSRAKFPQPLPDAYVALKSDGNKHIFLESFEESTQFFVIKKRINYYVEYAEDNDLPKSRPFPGIVFVCDTEKLKKKVEAFADKKFGQSWMEIEFAVFTRDEIGIQDNLFSFKS